MPTDKNKIAITNPTVFTTTADVKQWITAQAQALGFTDCGFFYLCIILCLLSRLNNYRSG